MLIRSLVTACQLRSVAARYRTAPQAWRNEGPALQQRAWRLVGNNCSRSGPLTTVDNERDHRLQRLEAVLYLAREPLTTRKLSQYANLADATEARTLIRRLNELYDRSGRAFHVERLAGGYQLLTRPQFATWVRRLEYVPRETRLSTPSLETLAVIAYRQPVLRADIEAIRGVNCEEILRQLMERDLVRIGGRSEDLGRPYYYTTTKRFLRLFGLESLDHLPRVEAIRNSAKGDLLRRGGQQDSHDQTTAGENKATTRADFLQEELNMPSLSLSGLALEPSWKTDPDEQVLKPAFVTAYEDEEDEFDYEDEEEYEDEGDEEEEDFEEDEDFDEEDFDEDEDLEADEEFEDEEWEEVDDEEGEEEVEDEDEDLEDESWEEDEEEEESDWDYEEEEDEEEEEEEHEDKDEDW